MSEETKENQLTTEQKTSQKQDLSYDVSKEYWAKQPPTVNGYLFDLFLYQP